MKRIIPRVLPALLSLVVLLAALPLSALASPAMGDDLTATDTLLNQQTQLSTNVFWSTVSSDYRTENLITYSPNPSVTPIVTYGGALTDRSRVSNTAKALEAQGYRVVAGINGDFYNVNNGLPIGLVVTQGTLRSSDGGYHAIGFRSDGTAVFGSPSLKTSVHGYVQNAETGESAEFFREITGVNKARTNLGIYLYTYDFNGNHTTGNSKPGVDVICSIQEGSLSIGNSAQLVVEKVVEATGATPIQPGKIVLSANAESGAWHLDALRAMTPGLTMTLSVTAGNPAWNEVQYAVGALYALVENGSVAPGLQAGANPRTAVGQRADGSVIFYTIDGRKSGHSIGATMTQVAQRLIELGCVTAYCLDGGGSTTLTVTQPTDTAAKTINIPSDGGERAVSNQIFLVASNQPTGVLDHFHVSADHPYVLAGSTVNISAAAVDTNFIPMSQNYDLSASAGTIDGGVLTTPLEGGEITVTASNGGQQGSTTVHAVTTPDDLAVRNASNTIITSLKIAPETSVQLHGSAAYRHFSLKADPAAFSWSVEGDIGTIDQNGYFTATLPGTGKITVTAGALSASIDVSVSTLHLDTVENFEGESTIFRGSGSHADFSLNRDGNLVHNGRGSGKLDYDLSEEGPAVWNATVQPAVVDAPYTGLNLWVYGDGSGNSLALHGASDGGETQVLPITTLDFTGWKLASVNGLTAPFTIQGLEVSGSGKGTVYLDQIVATYDGIVDHEAPVISAQLDQENWTVTGTVSDAVDALLPASAVTLEVNGRALGEYDASTGHFTISLPGPGESGGANRVTITARDASGNIGRASVDTEPYGLGTEHAFTDTAEYWGAVYCDFLYEHNISKGHDDGTFRPNENLTRLQFAVMLYNTLGVTGRLDPAKYADVVLPFADLASIPEAALPAVRALYAEGIVNGSTGEDGQQYFKPAGTLTRAQASAMIGRSQEKGYVSLADLSFTDADQIPGYAEAHIRSMAAQGILGGYQDGTFRPQNSITRGQMAKILYTML